MADPILEAFRAGAQPKEDDPILAAFRAGQPEWEGSSHQMRKPSVLERMRDNAIGTLRFQGEQGQRVMDRVGSNLSGLVDAIANPIDTLGAIRDKTTDEIVNAQMAFRDGNVAEGLDRSISAIPVAGAAVEDVRDNLMSGNLAEVAGDVATGAVLAGGAKGVAAGARGAHNAALAVPNKLRATGETVYRGAIGGPKKLADKTIPRMMDEGIKPHQDLTPQIDSAYKRVLDLQYRNKAVPHPAQDVYRNVLATASEFLDKTADGRVVPLNRGIVEYIKKAADEISQSSVNGRINTENLVRWRTEFGKRAKDAFEKQQPDHSMASVNESIANALSERINRASPDLATANHELSYLIDADKLAKGAPTGSSSVIQDVGMMAAFGITPYRIGKAAMDATVRLAGPRATIGIAMDRVGRHMGGTKQWPAEPFSPELAARTANQPKALPPSPVAGDLGPAPLNAPEGFVASDDLRRVGERRGQFPGEDSAVLAPKTDTGGMAPPDMPPALPGVKPQPMPVWLERSLQRGESNLMDMLQKQDLEAIRKGIVTRDMLERLARQGIDIKGMNPEQAHGWLARKLLDEEYRKVTTGAPTLRDILMGRQ